MKSFPLILLVASIHGAPTDKMADPADHIATDSQLIITEAEKTKLGIDTGDSYRFELSQPGVATGVYSWVDAIGAPHTTAYKSDALGYRTVPVSQLGFQLPPFPYSLYNAQPASFAQPATFYNTQPAAPRINDDMVVLDAIKPYKSIITDAFKTYSAVKDDMVVIEALKPETYGVRVDGDSDDIMDDDDEEEEEESTPDGDFTQEFLSNPASGSILPVPVKPGTPVAQSLPSATAIAGILGTAQVNPVSNAIVGLGGVAIAFPTGQALVGPGGVALAKPIASSQAGQGGVAIAGGTSTAVAGIADASEGVDAIDYTDEAASEPGFLTAKKKSLPADTPKYTAPSIMAMPVTTNYYFYLPATAEPKAETKSKKEDTPVYRPYPTVQLSYGSHGLPVVASSRGLPEEKQLFYSAPSLQEFLNQK